MISDKRCLLFKIHKDSRSTKVHNGSGNLHVHVFALTMQGPTKVEVVNAGDRLLYVVFHDSEARNKAFQSLNGVRLCIGSGLGHLKARKPDAGINATGERHVFRSSDTSDVLLVALQQWFTNRRVVTASSVRHNESGNIPRMTLWPEDSSSPL